MAGGSHTGVRPFRMTFHSTELETDVRRTFGYEGYCACGWQGQVRKEHSHARDDARRHHREMHEPPGVTDGAQGYTEALHRFKQRHAGSATGGTEAS